MGRRVPIKSSDKLGDAFERVCDFDSQVLSARLAVFPLRLHLFRDPLFLLVMFQRDPRAGAFLGGDRVSGQDIRDQNGALEDAVCLLEGVG